MPVAHHPAFKLVRSAPIDSLNLTIQEFAHEKTGAQHVHLASSNPENVFLVALRTVPQDSTGVAHILEHTALCGSKKYPVRDPFFMMTRRSLNTFMNAFTSSDWTAYPFASVNRKDFHNLLDVYLDAVFFSRLDQLDFAQEGHRLEFSEHTNSESALEYKGVVYNEMKGAMSSVPSQLWQTISKYLFPTTTYHHNSGGEPECIPDLSYDQLLSFYQTHYHPSNAIFMTFGDIPAIDLQTKFEEQALKHFDALDRSISVNNEKRYHAPIRVEESYPVNENEDESQKSHHVLGWLLGQSTDLDDTLTAHLISGVLLNNSASPLMHALETTELGQSPSPLCGVDSSQKEIVFLSGLEGCASDSADKVESLILGALEDIANNGVAQEDIEATLHQLELYQREIGGDSYPYGLQLILNALTSSTHRGNPADQLNIDSALESLRKKIQNPEFVTTQIKKLLIENKHRVRLSLVPDKTLTARKDASERLKLEKIKQSLNEEEKQAIVKQAIALKERQAKVDDDTILPRVGIEDIPEAEKDLKKIHTQLGRNAQLTSYHVGTNGIVYQQVIFDMPAIPEDLQQYLPLYTSCITEVGIGQKNYLEAQRWQTQVSGGIHAFSSVRGSVEDVHTTQSYLTFSSKALHRNHPALCELMEQIIEQAQFNEPKRVRELVAQIRASREQSVTGNGHGLAMLAASSGRCGTTALSHRLSGLEGIRRLKALDDSLKLESAVDTLCEKLQQLHALVKPSSRQYLLIGEADRHQQQLDSFKQVFNKDPASSEIQAFSIPHSESKIQQAWLTHSQVNFCAKSFPTVSMAHPDSASLLILGHVLRNNFLHTAVREQGGAYGGGASQDNNSASFRFYSYRDPRLEDTLKDFDRAVEWISNKTLESRKIEEAILGAISGIDKPDSPAGKAKRLFHSDISGRTLEQRQLFRERILNVKAEDLQRVAAQYLTQDQASTAVICDNSLEDKIHAIGLQSQQL